jgi:hypothetical protein
MKCLLNHIVSLSLLGSAMAFADQRIEVMTYNQYLGADIAPLFNSSPGDFNAALLGVLQEVSANNFQARSRAQAREIIKRQPHLVGLQEVWDFACQEVHPEGEVCQNPAIAGAFVDHLTETLAALNEEGGDYSAAAIVTNFDQTTPGIPFSIDDSTQFPQAFLQVIDRDVILARGDVTTSSVDYSVFQGVGICLRPSDDGCNYYFVAETPTPFGPLAIERGFVAVDAFVDEVAYRFVNTHLEVEQLGDNPASGFFQAAQAKELIDTLWATTPAQSSLLVAGDINSSPESQAVDGLPFPPPYQQFVDGGYTDIWSLRPGRLPGFTCCQAADLSNQKSEHWQRIDMLFAQWPPDRAKKVRVMGSKVSDRIPPPGRGLWPSDHGAVAAGLEYR